LFTLQTVAGYQRWPQANNDVTVKTLYSIHFRCILATLNNGFMDVLKVFGGRCTLVRSVAFC